MRHEPNIDPNVAMFIIMATCIIFYIGITVAQALFGG